MADISGVREAGSAGDREWSLVKVLDVTAVVLGSAVVVRAIGGILSALGIPSLQSTTAGFSIPTFDRLFDGTIWADLLSGFLLLAALALLALPRMVWDVPPDEQWPTLAPKVIAGVCIVAALTAIAAAVGIGNQIWHGRQPVSPTESLDVAQYVAALLLAALTSVLSWLAVPFIRTSPADQYAGSASD